MTNEEHCRIIQNQPQSVFLNCERQLKKEEQLPEYHAVTGGRAELPCNITQHSTEDKVSLVLWYKEDARAPIYSVDARNSPLEKAKHFPGATLGSRAYFETFTKPTILRIEPIQEKDAGIYRCRVDYRWARTFTHSMMLNVIVPPKETIILDIENNELSGVIGPYDEGSELRLRCESIGGYPPPTVTWWRGSTLLDDTFETLPDGVVRNDLVITTLQRSDLLMVLTCNANNNNATVAVATSVKINLNLKPIEARITSLRRTLSAGRRAELECTSTGSRPAARISWWIGTTQLTNTSESFSPDRNRTTSILNLWPTSDHNNKYLGCRAENPMLPGQPVEDGWTLNVSYVPRVMLSVKIDHGKQPTASEGSDVRFLCEIKANPWVIDVGWLSEDGRMINEPDIGVIIANNTLIIKRVQRKHAGNYQCYATNSEGTGHSEKVYLKVNYSPVCQAGQKIVYGVAKGEPARVECSVDAEPSDVSFRWNFNNTVEQHDILSFTSSGPTSVATYIPRSLKDFGKLYCWAKNKVGDQQVPCIFNIIPAEHQLKYLRNEEEFLIKKDEKKINDGCVEGISTFPKNNYADEKNFADGEKAFIMKREPSASEKKFVNMDISYSDEAFSGFRNVIMDINLLACVFSEAMKCLKCEKTVLRLHLNERNWRSCEVSLKMSFLQI
ncbi:nephrin [Trichonephila inaurata madagascariensis]|uniref:Nephrin n=1 Tax=Trichonephila inaurata madagascariensis TaxID=2747483 RepID=A0A8X6XYB9_9ARAC|nr:nephrin [Trichonephila inaurata madagascariensis]